MEGGAIYLRILTLSDWKFAVGHFLSQACHDWIKTVDR